MMKSLVFLCFLVLIQSFSFANHISPEEVENIIRSYVIEHTSSLPNARAGTYGMECYDQFIPLINNATEQSKTETETCVTDADTQKADVVNNMEEDRTKLANQVAILESSLTKCSEETDVLDYLNCFKNDVSANQDAISAIASTSTSLSQMLDRAFTQIEVTENDCVGCVIGKAKEETDALFVALQKCIVNGYQESSPSPDTTIMTEE